MRSSSISSVLNRWRERLEARESQLRPPGKLPAISELMESQLSSFLGRLFRGLGVTMRECRRIDRSGEQSRDCERDDAREAERPPRNVKCQVAGLI